MTKTHTQHVWIVFSALALCLVVLGFTPGLQPANARLAGYYPKPGMPGFPPPSNFARRPVFVMFRPGPPPERQSGFPPFRSHFVKYQHIRGVSTSTILHTPIMIPPLQATEISTATNRSQHNTHLWLENAQIPLPENMHGMLRPPAPEMHHHSRVVPPPDGLWFYAGLLLRGPFAESSQDSRLIQDRGEACSIKTVPQLKSHEGQNALTQQSPIPQDRLQSLRVLRL